MDLKIILIGLTLVTFTHGSTETKSSNTDILFVLSARKLPSEDIAGGKPDPYVKIIYYHTPTSTPFTVETSRLQDNHNPDWPEVFHLTFVDGQKQKVVFTIMDEDTFKKDDEIGRVEISLKELVQAPRNKLEKNIVGKKSSNGYLVISTRLNKSTDETDSRILQHEAQNKVQKLGSNHVTIFVIKADSNK